MRELLKIQAIKNVELHKDCYVFFVDLVENEEIFKAYKDCVYVTYLDKYYSPTQVSLNTVLPDSTKYEFIMKYCFEHMMIWQKRITGIVKNDIMNIYYAREGVLDVMGVNGLSVNGINKVTRYCMRRIYDYILDHYND